MIGWLLWPVGLAVAMLSRLVYDLVCLLGLAVWLAARLAARVLPLLLFVLLLLMRPAVLILVHLVAYLLGGAVSLARSAATQLQGRTATPGDPTPPLPPPQQPHAQPTGDQQ